MPVQSGSSPLTRGTRYYSHSVCLDRRFIPAHAGNTHSLRSKTHSQTVHPRSRGEHCRSVARAGAPRGSSPLTRGTRLRAFQYQPDHRFIPAHAGNTIDKIAIRILITVHPRSRGEHVTGRHRNDSQTGSSPLTRGTRKGHLLHEFIPRFIPAHAGNTTRSPVTRTFWTVHPRSRGEHAAFQSRAGIRAGSSPLTRGTHLADWRRARNWRFIPAHAGNTGKEATESILTAVHPRSRGEHLGAGFSLF